MRTILSVRNQTIPVDHIICQRGGNLPQCRNLAIAAIQHDYIIPLDGDDELPPDACERLADCLLHNPDIDIAYGDAMEVHEDHSGTPLVMPKEFSRETLRSNSVTLYSAMFRRSAWEVVGGYDETMIAIEDWELQARFWRHGCRAQHIGRCVLIHYLHHDSKIVYDFAMYGRETLLGWLRERVPEVFHE